MIQNESKHLLPQIKSDYKKLMKSEQGIIERRKLIDTLIKCETPNWEIVVKLFKNVA